MNLRKFRRMAFRLAASTLFAALVSCVEKANKSEVVYDLILTGGVIVDGTGADRYRADIAIVDGRVAAIGELFGHAAVETLNVQGLVVAPGFIDPHSHADAALRMPGAENIEGFLRQGVTTAVYGVDGAASLEEFNENIAAGSAKISGVNFMSYIGHNGVRRSVMGGDNRPPSVEELEEMKVAVRDAMELGAVGLSTGLMYLPGNYASTDEVVELTKVIAPYGGKYDSHIRDPANHWVESVEECLEIARRAGVEAHVAHLKAVGARNFGRVREVIEMINARIAAGETITADVYPYDGASTRPVMAVIYPANDEQGAELFRLLTLAAADGLPAETDMATLIRSLREYWRRLAPDSPEYVLAEANTETPPEGVFSWVRTVGYQSMRIVVSEKADYEGQMVTDLAQSLGITPFELFRRLVVDEGPGAMITLGAIQEDEVRAIMKQPWSIISSDGEEVSVEHPRGRGTFPRVVGRYVRDWNVFTLEEAVHKVTGATADYLELADRGVLRAGAVADITVFDPDRIIDNASWSEPTLYSEGVTHVLIDGKFALRDEEVTGARPGRFIPFKSGRAASE